MATGTDPVTADRDVAAVAAVLGHHCWEADSERTAHAAHRFHAWCAICQGDVNAIAAALLPLIREREAAAWERALEAVVAGVESAMRAHREHGHRESVSTLSGLLTAIPRTANPYAGSEGGE